MTIPWRHRNHSTKHPPDIKEKITKYLIENPVKAATFLLLTSGSVLLFIFFLRIGYMPDVQFESVSSILYAIALLGIFLAIYTMFTLIMPGLMLAQAKKEVNGLRTRNVMVVAAMTASIWAIAFCAVFEVSEFLRGNIAIMCIAAVILISPLAFIKWTGLTLAPNITSTTWARYGKVYMWSVVTAVALSLLTVAPVVLISVIGLAGDIRTANSVQSTILLSLLVLLIAASAVLIGDAPSSTPLKRAIALAPALLFFALLTTGSFSSFSTIAVKALGQGEITAARIAITGKTCKQINATLGYHVCNATDDETATAICPVMIRSRIGSQILLEFSYIHIMEDELKNEKIYLVTTKGAVDGNAGGSITRRVVIEKEKVLSWQPLKGFSERDESKVSEKNRSTAVATWIHPISCSQLRPLEQSLCMRLAKRCGNRI